MLGRTLSGGRFGGVVLSTRAPLQFVEGDQVAGPVVALGCLWRLGGDDGLTFSMPPLTPRQAVIPVARKGWWIRGKGAQCLYAAFDHSEHVNVDLKFSWNSSLKIPVGCVRTTARV